MPLEGDIMKRGSLFIVFNVEYPRNLTNEQLQALRSVFNVPLPVVPEMDVADLKPVNPEEYGKSVPGYVPKVSVVLGGITVRRRCMRKMSLKAIWGMQSAHSNEFVNVPYVFCLLFLRFDCIWDPIDSRARIFPAGPVLIICTFEQLIHGGMYSSPFPHS